MASRKRKPPPPTANEIRGNLIEWFYSQNKKGRSALGMQKLCAGIKADCGYKGPLVKEHLTYLLDLGYLAKESIMTRYSKGMTTRDQPKDSYRIAAKGIEFVEGMSEFSDRERYPGINITATGGSAIVLGDGNIVNSSYREIYEELGRMRQAIADSSELNDSDKLQASVSIETIRDQLALPAPDRAIIKRAWDAASKICTTATLIEYLTGLGALLADFVA